MAAKNAVEKCREIREKYIEYLKSTYNYGDDELQKMYEEQLEQEDLLKGPYIDMQLPFVRGKSIAALVEEGIVAKSFLKLGDIDFNRPLYSHQEKAIRHIGSGHSAIVTTGTGSGKTESFLFPILNEILADMEKGNTEPGIRAMFLYPMNALVNDQVDRFKKILSQYPEITFGFFTGDTDEDMKHDKLEQYRLDNNIPRNQLVTREEIRLNPPHLLFTNYSMLEYLLIRPNDYSIFTEKKLNNWKFVVLDEAHVYNGALGIELSMLLRRVTGLAAHRPRFILTSATLGKRGESEKKIIEFAHKLTAVDYDINDIIFSERIIPNFEKIAYSIDPQDYIVIKENITNYEYIKKLSSRYGCSAYENSISGLLYELLAKDSNVATLYFALKDGCRLFTDLLAKYKGDISVEQLIALIDIVNAAEDNGIRLFDLKYHSFIRPLAGGFINLSSTSRLSLTKTNEIDGYKAFEIGNCRKCNAPYIIGKIQTDYESKLQYLLQNKEVDIYENYGNNSRVQLDYFLIRDNFDTSSAEVTKFILCAKCGCIRDAQDLNAFKCNCGKDYERIIYRAEEDRTKLFNNIRKCPCCGNKIRSGIVRAINMGKDEGTAITAQMLLESMGEDVVPKPIQQRKTLFGRKTIAQAPVKIKQMLEFSDSRQQASFAAVFLDRNHTRLLSKRIVWEIIKNNNFKDLSVENLRGELAQLIRDKDLFDNDYGEQKNAWLVILRDLLRIDGLYDSESLGLYYFELDLNSLFSEVDDSFIAEKLGNFNIKTVKQFTDFLNIIFNVFKITPAINYAKSNLTDLEKQDNLEYRRFNNYVVLSGASEKHIKNLLPKNREENSMIRYVMKACNCTSALASELITQIFVDLDEVGFFKKDVTQKLSQIDAEKYIVKNYKTSKYYRCTKCGRLTPFNVNDTCIGDNCLGKLEECNPDEVLRYNYYRKQYKEKPIERLVVKEHTAQISRIKAKEYQENFKNKKINVLSCSTTFEMGVDIGSLEHVFMRNVPPTPANYVQRAGRAGRSATSSAFVLTYCGSGSHDYTYFLEPRNMIAGIINPPYFDIANDKIITRHLMASALGYFFRQNRELFKNVGTLIDENVYEKFLAYIKTKPKDLANYIDKRVLPEQQFSEYHNLKWIDRLEGKYYKFEQLVESIKTMIEEYEKAIEFYKKDNNLQEAAYCQKLIQLLKSEPIINSLSKGCVIPKYGFPVDVVPLMVYDNGHPDNRYDLSRDLKIAISEYAPESEVIVDKKKLASSYIILPKVKKFPKHYFITCPKCQRVNVFLTVNPDDKYLCNYCAEDIGHTPTESYIIPEYGFKTGETKQSTALKPKRSYSGEVSYLGGGNSDDRKIDIAGVIEIETSSEDELLIMNRSNFYMCGTCGFTKIPELRNNLPFITETHKNCNLFQCKDHTLNKTKLGHTFKTDVAKFTIPALRSNEVNSHSEALSFMYAFLEGVSEVFEIERTDIDGILDMNLEKSSYDVILYDNVPGGAGHVKRLLDKEEIIKALKAALRKVSQHCCDENTSCYNCLRNFNNQLYHNKLKRISAKRIIEELLNSMF